MNKKITLITAALLTSLLFVFCKKKNVTKNEEESANDSFNKQEMLVNMADNIILPCYRDFKVSLDGLTNAFATFKTTGSLPDFQALKTAFHSAYLKYQRVSIFGFGPGEDQSVRINFNIFPCDTAKILSNISGGGYNLATASNISTKGFPALDYLFYGKGKTEAEMLSLLAGNASRKKYVDDLLSDLSLKTNEVIKTWDNPYRAAFINSLGTDIGSSIGFVINQINYELDYLKNAKIATPLGIRSGGNPLPDNTEAYYGGNSLEYALETLNIIENMYLGRSFSGNNGLGFDDFLDHLGVKHLDGTLNGAINNQFTITRAKLNEIGNPLSDKVLSAPTGVNDAYKEIVKLVVLLKTDLPSNLGVVITYQDGDGD
jgi:predicted lipoprotein